jgi:hypothetical protein
MTKILHIRQVNWGAEPIEIPLCCAHIYSSISKEGTSKFGGTESVEAINRVINPFSGMVL